MNSRSFLTVSFKSMIHMVSTRTRSKIINKYGSMYVFLVLFFSVLSIALNRNWPKSSLVITITEWCSLQSRSQSNFTLVQLISPNGGGLAGMKLHPLCGGNWWFLVITSSGILAIFARLFFAEKNKCSNSEKRS